MAQEWPEDDLLLWHIARRIGWLRCIYCDRRVPWSWAKTRGRSWGVRTLRTCCEPCANRIAQQTSMTWETALHRDA